VRRRGRIVHHRMQRGALHARVAVARHFVAIRHAAAIVIGVRLARAAD
jgi:hypothetical protein